MTTLSEVYKVKGERSKKDISEDETLTNFFHSLVDVNSVSDIIDKIFNFLFELYHLEEGCFYYVDKRENMLTAFRRRSEELESVVILSEKLLSRIYSIRKTQTRKRSISLRKNIPTIYCPFHLDNSLEFMIELPVSKTVLNTNQIINELMKILPIIYISLKNADYHRFTELYAKETTKILQSISSGIASIDSKGTFLFANQMFEMMIGYSLNELLSSSTLINHIFPDFSFIIFEGNVVDNLIYNIRRKDGTEFPCHITITQVSKGDETTYILNLKDASYIIKQKEEIKNLRKSIANEDNIGVVLFRFASFGGELIKEDLRSIQIFPEYFSTMCYTSIAQGNKQPVGVFGPLPAPKLDNYRTIIYAFFGKDDIPLDHRMKGRQYYLIAVIFPERKTEFIISNNNIEKGFDDYIQKFEYPNRMKKQELSHFREIVFVD